MMNNRISLEEQIAQWPEFQRYQQQKDDERREAKKRELQQIEAEHEQLESNLLGAIGTYQVIEEKVRAEFSALASQIQQTIDVMQEGQRSGENVNIRAEHVAYNLLQRGQDSMSKAGIIPYSSDIPITREDVINESSTVKKNHGVKITDYKDFIRQLDNLLLTIKPKPRQQFAKVTYINSLGEEANWTPDVR